MFKVENFTNNDDVLVSSKKGPFFVAEYKRDLSVTPQSAQTAFFAKEMNVHKKQLVCALQGDNTVAIQAGAMQWTVGNVNATTGIKGAGDLFGKLVKGKMSGESAIKPEYTGTGMLVLEPTYKYVLLYDMQEWPGGVVLDDGTFLACEGTIKQTIVARSNISSAVAGGEGLFNLCLQGSGCFALESFCPAEELITVTLNNDVLKVDGNFAVAWSPSLNFTVERSSKTLLGSAASGEGLVNVYRGTGKVLLAPIDRYPNI